MVLKVSFLYCVSHGDCAVITFEENGDRKCIVVDGGKDSSSSKALRDHLDADGIEKIDLMVGTHIDSDHIEGLNQFLKEELRRKDRGDPYIPVGRFWGPVPSEDRVASISPAGASAGEVDWQRYVIESVAQNDRLFDQLTKAGVKIFHPALDNQPENPFHSVAIEVLGPDTQIPADEIKSTALGLTTRGSRGSVEIRGLEDLRGAVSRNFEVMAMEADRTANNQSIVFRLAPAASMPPGCEPWTFLFPGDAGASAWETMLEDASVCGRLSARVLKVPHHGSRTGITSAAAQRVKPAYSIISVGQEHGLPDEDILQMVQSLESGILCTQRNSNSKKRSACYGVSGDECPAKGDPQTITFTIDTDAGTGAVAPSPRACQHSW